MRASGHVFFHNFERNMKMWAGHLTYNTDEETGKFYDVIGETQPHIVAKPGMLTTNNPFHFEGEWAERIGAKYILHHGFITNCKTPRPWWRLRGKSFDIVPGERAIAHNSMFVVRNMPLFYTPFFYHSLEKEPRKSGFLLPLMGHSSRRGWMVHAGYFWAINRSYDLTYRAQYYTTARPRASRRFPRQTEARHGLRCDRHRRAGQGRAGLGQPAAEIQRRQPAGRGPERSRQGLDGARQY